MRWPRSAAFFRALGAAVLCAAALPAAGADDPGVVPFQVEVGQEKRISAGPIRELMCDDGSLVAPAFRDDGVVLKGLRAGTTLCSYRDVASIRTVLRVVVVESPGRGG